MKKWMAFVSLPVLIVSLLGCREVESTSDTTFNPAQTAQASGPVNPNDTAAPAIEVGAFSYEEELKVYKENDPGVYYNGFSNTSPLEVASAENAVERAKVECTIEYDTINVSYDGIAGVWRISFSTAGIPGGDQSVYLRNNGVTCLIVYGE